MQGRMLIIAVIAVLLLVGMRLLRLAFAELLLVAIIALVVFYLLRSGKGKDGRRPPSNP